MDLRPNFLIAPIEGPSEKPAQPFSGRRKTEPITHPPQGVNERRVKSLINLVPQITHVNIDNVCLRIEGIIPDML
jgi:hypothetical protein